VKISSKSVHNCKSWQSSIYFTKKRANIFYSKTYENIKKKRVDTTRQSICFFRRIWKKYFDPTKQTFFRKPPKKQKHIILQSHTPCLNSQSVKKLLQSYTPCLDSRSVIIRTLNTSCAEYSRRYQKANKIRYSKNERVDL